MTNCPDENTIARFVRGSLARPEARAVEEHVDRCSACAALLTALAQIGEGSARGPSPELSPSLAPTERVSASGGALVTEPVATRPGSLDVGGRADGSLGRYMIERLLGAGAMGVVYVAFDPVLGRRVALKLLRSDRFAGEDVLQANARLLREARMAAALAHPNVVHVYDAGVLAAQVFVAMELVDGPTLAEWLRAVPRDSRAILARFREAALGLAAAHEAGILHRDFKPANVLVGADGRARVSDFGLARESGAVLSGLPEQGVSSSNGLVSPSISGLPELSATGTGVLVGTPAYMSPEQLSLRPLDARADQFSFCVALYEALYGARPFGGETLAERRACFAGRPPAPPPDHRGAPPAVATVLLRGLSVAPEQRYPSMRALVDALDTAVVRAGDLHIVIHAVCQVLAFLVHVGFLVLFLLTDSDSADGDLAEDPAEVVTSLSASEGAAEHLFEGMFIGLIVLIAATPAGLVWAPLNAIGLIRRAPWARRSTMAYGIFSLLTVFGLPYGVYALWSLRRPDVKDSFDLRPAK